jgi:anhydro-N-acetylmuramic acid kinase
LHHAALAANALATAYAEVVASLLQATSLSRPDICAIGAHGQTVRHQPGLHDATGYTIQLLNGARLAELSGINVVCDFRTRDVAAGGQGAPLVPAFHQALFARAGRATAVLNIGGISNLTLLAATGSVGGFDCGPGNVLLDLWCQQHCGTDYDNNGDWSAGGQVDGRLLSTLLGEPYFQKAPPKSTGRDLFNHSWLQRQLDTASASASESTGLNPRNVQATLAALTAKSIADALTRYLPAAEELLICGGGALNKDLCRRLQAFLPEVTVRATTDAGILPMQVEAAAFAWLAHRFVNRLPGNCSAVTGAQGSRILGCLYPA